MRRVGSIEGADLVTHPNFTPLPKGIVVETFALQPDPHAVALARVARHFNADAPTRMDEALIDAVGYVEFHDLVQRGCLRIEIVDGDDKLVHVVSRPPSPEPQRARVAFGPNLTV
jgi:hypothetical protein